MRDVGLDRSNFRFALRTFRHVGEFLTDAHFQIATELNIGTATGHVGGDGDRSRYTGLRDDIGFLLVIAGVQDLEFLDAFLAKAFCQLFRLFDRGRADEDRLSLSCEARISRTMARYFSSTVR